MKEKNSSTIISSAIILHLCLGIFAYTVEIRRPYLGNLTPGLEWLTASTVKFTNIWLREGAWNLKFQMIENPKSIEFQDLSSRVIYNSYPPGTLLPVYLICKIGGFMASPKLVMIYNLFNHFLMAILMGFTIFIFLSQSGFKKWISLIFSMIPLLLQLLLPVPIYYFQNVFFSDQAVLLPFVMAIFFEVLKDGYREGKSGNRNKILLYSLNILQIGIFLLGTLTDWLFFFVMLAIYLKRIYMKEIWGTVFNGIKKSILFWIPALVSICLFIFQIFISGTFSVLKNTFLFRVGIDEAGKKYMENFNFDYWFVKIPQGYSLFGGILILLSGFLITFLLIKSYKANYDFSVKRGISLSFMYILPCILQTYALRSHSIIHPFSVLKFSIILCTVPFVLLPAVIQLKKSISLSDNQSPKQSKKKTKEPRDLSLKNGLIHEPMIPIVSLILCIIYIGTVHDSYKNMFPTQELYCSWSRFLSVRNTSPMSCKLYR